MTRRVLCLAAVALVVATPGGAHRRGPDGPELALGGLPLQLVAARGSLWVLTCDRRCSGAGRRSVGRIVRVDPRTGGVVASASIERPGVFAVGPAGAFAPDFWRDTVRRLDPRTLRETASVRLVLPYEVVEGDREFLPSELAVGARGVWVGTRRGMLVHADGQLRVLGKVRLPPATTGGVALGAGAVWSDRACSASTASTPLRIALRLGCGSAPATAPSAPTGCSPGRRPCSRSEGAAAAPRRLPPSSTRGAIEWRR